MTIEKTWIVTSDHPRDSHAEVDGETVPFQETFSNGLLYPGDGSTGNIEDVAGCTCLIAIEGTAEVPESAPETLDVARSMQIVDAESSLAREAYSAEAADSHAIPTITQELRAGTISEDALKWDRLIEEFGTPGQERPLYRAVPGSLTDDLTVGSKFTDPGFLYVHEDPNIVTAFKDAAGIELRIPEDMKWIWGDSFPGERILPRNITWNVVEERSVITVNSRGEESVVRMLTLEPEAASPLADLQYGTDSMLRQAEARVENAAAKFEGLSYRATDAEIQASVDKFTVQAENQLNSLFTNPDLRMSIRAPAGIDSTIFNDGRFLSQFESSTSGGLLNPTIRAEEEAKLFGYAADLPAAERPIYGYLSDASMLDPAGGVTPVRSGVSSYGSTEFILNPSVLERATWTGTDSLNITGIVPSPVLDPSVQSMDLSFPNVDALNHLFGSDSPTIADLMNVSNSIYTEAQVHGGLVMDDVQSIRLWGSGNEAFQQQLTDAGWQIIAKDESNPVALPQWVEWARGASA